MIKNKLLIVEDSVNLGLLYKQELEDDGYEVEIAETGREALKLFKINSFDLVILDLFIPEMDGLEVLSHLLVINDKIPVIINTAYMSYKENFISWTADAYVLKSSDLSELKEKIHSSLPKKMKLNLEKSDNMVII